MGASLSGTSKQVAVVGSWLYNISSNLEAVKIGDIESSSLTAINLSTFNDLLIIGTEDGPKSWDQTTFQILAGTPPAFTFSAPHAGRHWAAGVSTLPSRLYYSAVGNPEDWVGAGSGSIDIDPGDGDAIQAILSWKRELWVFKGPYRLSIHRITGTSPSDFSRVPFIHGISAAGQHSIFPVGDDFAFWSPRGSCHSLTSTANYGDYLQSYVNFPILSWCRNLNNIFSGELSKSWQVVTDLSQNVSYCVLNNNYATVNSPAVFAQKPTVIIMDWKFKSDENPYPRFIKLTLDTTTTAVGLLPSITNPAQLLPTFGKSTGNIVQEYDMASPFYLNGDTTVFPYKVETPSLTYGPSSYTKTIAAVSVDIVSNANVRSEFGTLDFSYGGREAPGLTLNFSNKDGVGLGTFVLGVDQLGEGTNIPNHVEAVTGESRAFSYTMIEDGALSVSGIGTTVQVKQFGVLVTPNGESLEN
jgi:hypothetical protein